MPSRPLLTLSWFLIPITCFVVVIDAIWNVFRYGRLPVPQLLLSVIFLVLLVVCFISAKRSYSGWLATVLSGQSASGEVLQSIAERGPSSNVLAIGTAVVATLIAGVFHAEIDAVLILIWGGAFWAAAIPPLMPDSQVILGTAGLWDVSMGLIWFVPYVSIEKAIAGPKSESGGVRVRLQLKDSLRFSLGPYLLPVTFTKENLAVLQKYSPVEVID